MGNPISPFSGTYAPAQSSDFYLRAVQWTSVSAPVPVADVAMGVLQLQFSDGIWSAFYDILYPSVGVSAVSIDGSIWQTLLRRFLGGVGEFVPLPSFSIAPGPWYLVRGLAPRTVADFSTPTRARFGSMSAGPRGQMILVVQNPNFSVRNFSVGSSGILGLPIPASVGISLSAFSPMRSAGRPTTLVSSQPSRAAMLELASMGSDGHGVRGPASS